MPIGVTGCNIDLPETFPLSFKDNAGNMVHANAPLGMFEDCHHSSKTKNFPAFVNDHCSHLIVTMANLIQFKEIGADRLASLTKFLSFIKKPIIIFGLGVQGSSEEDLAAGLPQDTVHFLKFLQDKATVIGVRGHFTQRVLEACAGVNNAFVTGCPSFFSRQDLVRALRTEHAVTGSRAVYSGTHLFKPLEQALLANAIHANTYYIEPFNKLLHIFHEDLQHNDLPEKEFPYFIRTMGKQHRIDTYRIQAFFKNNYHLFRNLRDWFSFIRNHVSFSYGSRFHVNTAAFLGGRPAMWMTHDTRTRELVEYFKLPHMDLHHAAELKTQDICSAIDLTPFFDNYHFVSNRFNEFLGIAGLPQLTFQT